jgi:hypothetical protein
MISLLRIKLNRSWKFQRNWNVPLVLVERSWWAGFNGIYLLRFGFKMWETVIFKWFLLLNFLLNSQKIRFWKEKSVENVVTFEGLPFIQAWFPFIFSCSKNQYIHYKTMFTCWVSLFCNEFTLGPTAQATLVSLNIAKPTECTLIHWGRYNDTKSTATGTRVW